MATNGQIIDSSIDKLKSAIKDKSNPKSEMIAIDAGLELLRIFLQNLNTISNK